MFGAIVIDSVGLGYKVFNGYLDRTRIGNKTVYKEFVKEFIRAVSFLQWKYFSPYRKDGQVYLLFDNYHSREELLQEFQPLTGTVSRKDRNSEYKAHRKREAPEFYNSLDLIKFYYMVNIPRFKTVKIPKLEADDLVKPCLEVLKDEGVKKILLVTTDSDWYRYLKQGEVECLPYFNGEPFTSESFLSKYGYPPTEGKIVLHKLITGDSADNIPPTFPEFSKQETLDYVLKYEDVFDFMLTEVQNNSPRAVLIKSRESFLRVNYQMISAVKISKEHFLYNRVVGRNSTVQFKALDKILFPPDETAHFDFGGLKVPRVTV